MSTETIDKKWLAPAFIAKIQKLMKDEKYKNRIPIIIETFGPSNNFKLLNQQFFVPKDMTVQEFLFKAVRPKVEPKISSSEALFLYFDNTLYSGATTTVGDVFQEMKKIELYKDLPFLIGKVGKESTFGGFHL